jgi:hypothetical protein
MLINTSGSLGICRRNKLWLGQDCPRLLLSSSVVTLPHSAVKIYFILYAYMSVIMSDYGLDDRAIEVRFPAEGKGFFL